ncbi:MAG: type II toxin-antitoxin system Phd/YefM family antitoxin [Terriglobales bacterium]|jgi:antitoxin (DNA-binding transcriptional repressor) of toxin-antitoxin stability system
MRRAGVREARQNLSKLLAEVAKGNEIIITDRGKDVARLGPPPARVPFPDLAEFRARMPKFYPPLTQTLIEEREEERNSC